MTTCRQCKRYLPVHIIMVLQFLLLGTAAPAVQVQEVSKHAPASTAGPVYRDTYIGCYNEALGQRTLPMSLSRAGLSIDGCAAAARDRGYPVFSLQSYGSCFMGSVADVAKMNSAAQTLTTSMCSSIPCDTAAASCPPRVNAVFLLEGHSSVYVCDLR